MTIRGVEADLLPLFVSTVVGQFDVVTEPPACSGDPNVVMIEVNRCAMRFHSASLEHVPLSVAQAVSPGAPRVVFVVSCLDEVASAEVSIVTLPPSCSGDPNVVMIVVNRCAMRFHSASLEHVPISVKQAGSFGEPRVILVVSWLADVAIPELIPVPPASIGMGILNPFNRNPCEPPGWTMGILSLLLNGVDGAGALPTTEER